MCDIVKHVNNLCHYKNLSNRRLEDGEMFYQAAITSVVPVAQLFWKSPTVTNCDFLQPNMTATLRGARGVPLYYVV